MPTHRQQKVSSSSRRDLPSPLIHVMYTNTYETGLPDIEEPCRPFPDLASKRTSPLWLRSSYLHGIFDSPFLVLSSRHSQHNTANSPSSHGRRDEETGRPGKANPECDSRKGMPILWREHLSARPRRRECIRCLEFPRSLPSMQSPKELGR